MKRIFLSLCLILIGSIVFGATTAFAQKKKMAKKPILWAAEDIKWVELKDAPPGAMGAALWGNMAKGAYGALAKFGQAMDNPLHTHTNDTKAVVISGSFWYASEGGEKKMLGPGSYFMIPGGLRHTSGAEAGTIMFQEGPGKFDMKMVKAAMEKKK